jgi:hypothetical protein
MKTAHPTCKIYAVKFRKSTLLRIGVHKESELLNILLSEQSPFQYFLLNIFLDSRPALEKVLIIIKKLVLL